MWGLVTWGAGRRAPPSPAVPSRTCEQVCAAPAGEAGARGLLLRGLPQAAPTASCPSGHVGSGSRHPLGRTLPHPVGSGYGHRQSALCQDLITSCVCIHAPLQAVSTHRSPHRGTRQSLHAASRRLITGGIMAPGSKQNESTFSSPPRPRGLCGLERGCPRAQKSQCQPGRPLAAEPPGPRRDGQSGGRWEGRGAGRTVGRRLCPSRWVLRIRGLSSGRELGCGTSPGSGPLRLPPPKPGAGGDPGAGAERRGSPALSCLHPKPHSVKAKPFPEK